MNLALQKNLKKLMVKHGNLSVSCLAKATHLPQPTLYQLYTGVTEKPRGKTLLALADYFSITVDQLLGTEVLPNHLPEKVKQQLELHTAPLLAWEDLQHWPDQINFNHKKEIYLDQQSSQTTFAIHLPDSSMEPLLPNGCLLILDTEKTAKNKDCAIIFLNETQQFVFKKILTQNEQIYIQSTNPACNNTHNAALTKEDKIFATLLEARLTF
jgi:SOS-response transcriptional repressor LexA